MVHKDGITKKIKEAGISPSTYYQRLKRGMTSEEALSKPPEERPMVSEKREGGKFQTIGERKEDMIGFRPTTSLAHRVRAAVKKSGKSRAGWIQEAVLEKLEREAGLSEASE